MVVGEGIKNKHGRGNRRRQDAPGCLRPSGAGRRGRGHQGIVQGKLNTKTRTVLLGYAQRAAAHCASLTDANNAFACGEAAVKAAIDGPERIHGQDRPRDAARRLRQWSTGLQPLADIANVEHFVPRDWISEDGFLPNEKFVEYARPLIEGEVKAPIEGGLPKYVVLEKTKVEKKLPPR